MNKQNVAEETSNNAQTEAPKPGTIAGERDAFFTYLKETKGTSDATIYTYGKDMDIVESFFKPEKELAKVIPAQVSNFLKSNVFLYRPNGKARAKPTINKTARVLRMFLTWAVETKKLEKLPLPKNAQLGGKSLAEQEASEKERLAKAEAREKARAEDKAERARLREEKRVAKEAAKAKEREEAKAARAAARAAAKAAKAAAKAEAAAKAAEEAKAEAEAAANCEAANETQAEATETEATETETENENEATKTETDATEEVAANA